MTKLNVKLKDLDEELLIKKTEIKIGSHKITTPTKSSFKKLSEGSITEIYKNYNSEMLENCYNNADKLNSVEASVRRDTRDNTVNFMIPYYNDIKIPSENQLHMMSDLQYSYSDVSITPCWSHLIYKYEDKDSSEIMPQIIDINENIWKIWKH
jgi:hypothetical protein